VNEGVSLKEALPSLSEQQQRFLCETLTPAEQRIVRDPAYQQSLDDLRERDLAGIKTERAAILQSAENSQLEPYDYKLSLRHQAFNAALRMRPEINQSVNEVNWIRDIAPRQYQSQLRRDPTFTPEARLSAVPGWANAQLSREAVSNQSKPIETAIPRARREVAGDASQVAGANVSDKHVRFEQGVFTATSRNEPTGPITEHFPSSAVSLSPAEDIGKRIMGDRAKTFPPQTDSGIYRGEIVAHTDRHVLQRLNPETAVVHSKDMLGRIPDVGSSVIIRYSNASARVDEVPIRSRVNELGR
jgi:hypothetical protein